MVCKEAMVASGARVTSYSLSGVHCVRVAVQHGLGARETWLLRTGSRLESQYGGPMALVPLKAGEHARHRIGIFSSNPCSAVEMLRKWHSLPRLETRTKGSDVYASIWVSNPDAQ